VAIAFRAAELAAVQLRVGRLQISEANSFLAPHVLAPITFPIRVDDATTWRLADHEFRP
jgi:hypothetical protein